LFKKIRTGYYGGEEAEKLKNLFKDYANMVIRSVGCKLDFEFVDADYIVTRGGEDVFGGPYQVSHFNLDTNKKAVKELCEMSTQISSNLLHKIIGLEHAELCVEGRPNNEPIPKDLEAFQAAFKRDDEGRLRLEGRLRQDEKGPWWFRTVYGTSPEGRRTLIIWRKLTGDAEQDSLVLDEWFTRQGYSTRDYEFDMIYVNGDCNLENLRAPDETWKVRLIEEDFHRLMFDMTGL
jgi:hypothetical protein